MARQLFNAIITATLVLLVSIASRKSLLLASLFASLPITSIITLTWLYKDGQSLANIQTVSTGILWMIIPSLSFFIAMSGLIKAGLGFYPSLITSCIVTMISYALFTLVLSKFGIQ